MMWKGNKIIYPKIPSPQYLSMSLSRNLMYSCVLFGPLPNADIICTCLLILRSPRGGWCGAVRGAGLSLWLPNDAITLAGGFCYKKLPSKSCGGGATVLCEDSISRLALLLRRESSKIWTPGCVMREAHATLVSSF